MGLASVPRAGQKTGRDIKAFIWRFLRIQAIRKINKYVLSRPGRSRFRPPPPFFSGSHA